MEKGLLLLLMGATMKENFMKTRFVVLENTIGKMAKFMRGNGKIIR